MRLTPSGAPTPDNNLAICIFIEMYVLVVTVIIIEAARIELKAIDNAMSAAAYAEMGPLLKCREKKFECQIVEKRGNKCRIL